MYKKHDRRIKEILDYTEGDVDWKEILKEHKDMIKIIQHERLIHLLVTIFVGITFSLFCVTTIITGNLMLGLLDFLLLFLFLGYIFHYRFLENTTQSWYALTDKIKEKVKK